MWAILKTKNPVPFATANQSGLNFDKIRRFWGEHCDNFCKIHSGNQKIQPINFFCKRSTSSSSPDSLERSTEPIWLKFGPQMP